MKKTISRSIIKILALGLLIALFSATLISCEARKLGFGSQTITDPAEYGNFGVIDAPVFFPKSIDGCKVNSYSYILRLYLETCYEIFLDLTVSADKLDSLVASAKIAGGFKYEREAYYAAGYRELVFCDYYEPGTQNDDGNNQVGYAWIEKVIFNPDTGNIIYVSFIANDWSVYSLSEVEYFKKFGIKEAEYTEHTEEDMFGV